MATLDRPTRLKLLRFVCAMAWADLEVVEAEREALRELLRRLELDDAETRAQVQRWLALPPPADEVDPLTIPLEQRELFVRECQRMVEADGVVVDAERDAMELLRGILGLL